VFTAAVSARANKPSEAVTPTERERESTETHTHSTSVTVVKTEEGKRKNLEPHGLIASTRSAKI